MDKQQPNKMSPSQEREQRLAAKLRENLRRRKAQTRAMAQDSDESHGDSGANGVPKE